MSSYSRRSDEPNNKMTSPKIHSSVNANGSKRTTPQVPQSSHNAPMRFKSTVPENLSLTGSIDSLECLSHRSNENINNTTRRPDSGGVLTSGRTSSSNSHRTVDDNVQKLSARRNNGSGSLSSRSNYDRKTDDSEYKSINNTNNKCRMDSSSSNNSSSHNNHHHHSSSSDTYTAKQAYSIRKDIINNNDNSSSKPGILTTETGDEHTFKRAYNRPISSEENAVIQVYREREIKVFEACNDDRKMPILPQHQTWLLNRDVELKQKEEEYLRSIINGKNKKDTKNNSSKGSSSGSSKKESKNSSKDKDTSNTNKNKSNSNKMTSAKASNKLEGIPVKNGMNDKITAITQLQPQQQLSSSSSVKLPYTLATEFMTRQFPSFTVNQNQRQQQQELLLPKDKNDDDDDLHTHNNHSSNVSNHTTIQQSQPLRPPLVATGSTESILHQRQIKECQSIMKAFEKSQLSAPNSIALVNALVLPQDLPDIISVGQLKMNSMCLTEKLMNNPLPIEFLRTNKLLKNSSSSGKRVKKKKKQQQEPDRGSRVE